ncbi:uncharacterized protein G2W53_035644 [Senna tora]|uniref:Uncharacterized protein n=1 Tax=Senna tora TaxID=362788 RepID=A0A834SSM3_9FABA|nr:uncharacterized protein G2W53_035644 [Senna tora]
MGSGEKYITSAIQRPTPANQTT